MVIPAEQLSGSYILGLLGGTALGMTIAPVASALRGGSAELDGFPWWIEFLGTL